MVSYLHERSLVKPMRGDQVKANRLQGRRVTTSRWSARRVGAGRHGGFTLIELVITVTVLSILTLGVVPLMTLSVKRQKEQQLRDALRQMRMSIDEFRRDTVNMPRTGLGSQLGGGLGGQQGPQPQQQIPPDPRSKVVISDPTIFGVDNPDLYPPDLDTLVNGVNVIPRASQATGGQGLQSTGTNTTNTTSVLGSQLATVKKVYLRAIPINPFTGGNEIGKDWKLRSCYDEPGAADWGGQNVFDVVFPPDKDGDFKPLKEGDKYSEW